MAFAGAVEEAAEILEGIDDIPFGEGEEGVVQFAPVARLVDRGQFTAGAPVVAEAEEGRQKPSI